MTGDDEYGTFRPGSYTRRSEVAAMVARVVRPDLRRTLSLNSNVPFVSISHSWQYPAYSGATYYMTLQMNAADVDYFKALPRTYDYASYANDYADYTYMSSLASSLKIMAIENGITDDYSIAEFITAFVQNSLNIRTTWYITARSSIPNTLWRRCTTTAETARIRRLCS